MIKHTFHTILFVLCLGFNTSKALATEDFKLITQTTEFIAGDTVILKFECSDNRIPNLYVSNSFGSTLIKAEKTKQVLSYTMPYHIASRTGILNWILLTTPQPLKGSLKILPDTTVKTIQNYLGPPSIVAGGNDFSMLVSIPTDTYDNPLAEGTKVIVSHQFENSRTVDTVTVNNNIAYKNLFSNEKTGRIFLNASCLGLHSKEYDINVMPAPATNFKIDYKRRHKYADGNQITGFSTSEIQDAFGNVVSDGTFVTFFITTSNQTILKTYGTTINGVATASMIHPTKEDKWSIQAIIEGMAESNRISIAYEGVVSNFEIALSDNNRHITVGPLTSFMNQKIPDGLEVILEVYAEGKLMQTLRKQSNEGYVKFTLNPIQFPSRNYSLIVKTAGIEKSIASIKI